MIYNWAVVVFIPPKSCWSLFGLVLVCVGFVCAHMHGGAGRTFVHLLPLSCVSLVYSHSLMFCVWICVQLSGSVCKPVSGSV